jgi:methylisocitrate lyase
MSPAAQFRGLMREGRTIWAAGAYDAMSGRLIGDAGFDAVLTSGFGVSASYLGQPDAELYTMTENLAVVRNVVGATSIPVVADVDTGYGNPINVMRTVREFEQAGVAAMIIEDQVSPKRCPICVDQVEIITLEEGVAKIRAAAAARRNPDTVIIARTDAVDQDEAMRRGKAYADAGADIIQPISKTFKDAAGLKRMREACGKRLSLQILGWLERDLTRQDIEAVAAIATYPLVPLMTVAAALRKNLEALAAAKSSKNLPLPVMGHNDFLNFIGFPAIEKLQVEYLQPAQTTCAAE